MDTMFQGGKSNSGEINQDLGKMIQTELAKCFGNLMRKTNSIGNLATDVNMVEREESGTDHFDGHFDGSTKLVNYS